MTRFDPHTGEPDPYTDSWLDIPLLEDERPRSGMVLLYIGVALILGAALIGGLVWAAGPR